MATNSTALPKTPATTRIQRRFEALGRRGEMGLVAFLTAGDPSLQATESFVLALDEAIRFFAEELMPHLRLEDEAVLPTIEKAIGRYGTLVTVVMYEHEEIRRGIAKFDEAREELRRDPNSWPAIQELNRHGIFLVQFLWDHFRKENTSLFPTARKVLSADAIRELTEQISAP